MPKEVDILWKHLNSVLNIMSYKSNKVESINHNGEMLSGSNLANTFNSHFAIIDNSSYNAETPEHIR